MKLKTQLTMTGLFALTLLLSLALFGCEDLTSPDDNALPDSTTQDTTHALAVGAEYFPLQVGNTWLYDRVGWNLMSNFHDGFRVTVVEDTTFEGVPAYVISTSFWFDTTYEYASVENDTLMHWVVDTSNTGNTVGSWKPWDPYVEMSMYEPGYVAYDSTSWDSLIWDGASIRDVTLVQSMVVKNDTVVYLYNKSGMWYDISTSPDSPPDTLGSKHVYDYERIMYHATPGLGMVYASRYTKKGSYYYAYYGGYYDYSKSSVSYNLIDAVIDGDSLTFGGVWD